MVWAWVYWDVEETQESIDEPTTTRVADSAMDGALHHKGVVEIVKLLSPRRSRSSK